MEGKAFSTLSHITLELVVSESAKSGAEKENKRRHTENSKLP